MKARTRITALVMGLSLVAGGMAAGITAFVTQQQSYSFLDDFLYEEAKRVIEVWQEHNASKTPFDQHHIDELQGYWLRLMNPSSAEVLYSDGRDLPLRLLPPSGKTKTVRRDCYNGHCHGSKHGSKHHAIRFGNFTFSHNDRPIQVLIGRSLSNYDHHIRHLYLASAVGLVTGFTVLVALSFVVVGRILQPIGQINALVKKIGEKNLQERLPVEGKDEFSDLAQTLNDMLNRLQYSFEKQRNLLFDTSHEMKTPLSTMRLALEKLGRGIEQKEPENLLLQQERLSKEMARLERLVKSLLKLSALEAQREIAKEQLDISMILRELVDDYVLLATHRNINVQTELAVSVISGNRQLLRRAFSNMLDNALKYNITGGTIHLSCGLTKNDIEVICGNTGAGVRPEDQALVFDQFYRAEKSRSTETGGFGLGLAMVKRIIQLHNGEVRFHSIPEEWTEIRIRFDQN